MTSFNPKLALSITNSKELFEKLQLEYLDFDKDYLSARHAINAAITSWHISDWTFNEFYKNDPAYQDRIKTKKGETQIIKGLQIYQQALTKKCPSLNLMKNIANGSKHCILNDQSIKDETRVADGDFAPSDFHRFEFLTPEFIIKTKDKEVLFERELVLTIFYWNTLLEKLYSQKLCSSEILDLLNACIERDVE